MRAYLRRELQKSIGPFAANALQAVLEWVLTRQKRYDKRAGGL